MHRSPRHWWDGFALFAGMLAGILLVGMWRPEVPAQRHNPPPNHNPNKFYLWAATGTFTYTYTFTYDPRAADEWLFESGGLIDSSRVPWNVSRQDQHGRSIPARSSRAVPGAPLTPAE